MMLAHQIFDPETNKRVLLDHAFIVAGGEITKQARAWLGKALDNAMRSQIMFIDRDDILNLYVVNTNLGLRPARCQPRRRGLPVTSRHSERPVFPTRTSPVGAESQRPWASFRQRPRTAHHHERGVWAGAGADRAPTLAGDRLRRWVPVQVGVEPVGDVLRAEPVQRPPLEDLGDHRPPRHADDHANLKVCIVGASGKLGQYRVLHALDRGYEVVGVCRAASVDKLDRFKGRITVVPGATDDRAVIQEAVAGCDAVLTSWCRRGFAGMRPEPPRRSSTRRVQGRAWCSRAGWHITRDGQDVYPWKIKVMVHVVGRLARLARVVDLDDQVEACRRVFASDTRWTVVRGSDLEEGESQGLPVWSRHVGDPVLKSNITRRVDFALFMVAAIENDELVHEAPAIVGCRTPSALAYAASTGEDDP
jgi:NAD(P)-dependent dehydrogenase (short-subunit alcohol dehydrogenase family)